MPLVNRGFGSSHIESSLMSFVSIDSCRTNWNSWRIVPTSLGLSCAAVVIELDWCVLWLGTRGGNSTQHDVVRRLQSTGTEDWWCRFQGITSITKTFISTNSFRQVTCIAGPGMTSTLKDGTIPNSVQLFWITASWLPDSGHNLKQHCFRLPRILDTRSTSHDRSISFRL